MGVRAGLAAETLWRVAQFILIGVTPRLSEWQALTLMSVLFHHSNVRLPVWLERRLVLVIVTPRMHGIHHSIVQGETDSNWSSGLTLWDRLHGTLRLDVPQDKIMIGAPGYESRQGGGLLRLLLAPCGKRMCATGTNRLPQTGANSELSGCRRAFRWRREERPVSPSSRTY